MRYIGRVWKEKEEERNYIILILKKKKDTYNSGSSDPEEVIGFELEPLIVIFIFSLGGHKQPEGQSMGLM